MSVMPRRQEIIEARQRLAPKYGDDAVKGIVERFGSYELPPIDCVVEVARVIAEDARADWSPVPTPEDVDDALLAVRDARRWLLEDELALIEAARANDRSWERIAELLGVSVPVAKGRPATIRRAIEDMNRI